MILPVRSACFLVALLVASTACGETPQPAAAVDPFFLDEVWAKVGSQVCLTCHKAGGDAEDSQFVLRDPLRVEAADRDEAHRHNHDAFARMARINKNDPHARILLKVVGALEHGGADVLKPNSTGYRILAELVQRVNLPVNVASARPPAPPGEHAPPFFDGIVMLNDQALLRRVTLSLAGRLPSSAEISAIDEQGRKALPSILDGLMQEDVFYTRLREGFNDIFLTLGVIGNPDQTVLSYEYFTKTRQWYGKHDLSHIKDEVERRRAGYKLADEYRAALLGEPMKLVEYIVRNDRPFTEIITADYILVSPYSARGYGVYDELKDQFQDPDDPFEYVPVKLKALEARSPNRNQESATGFYPHAGILSTFQYLRRYPTTETNRNRLRARMYFQHFLGIDVMELAARVDDAAAVTARYEIPTMQASECVVCHKTIDPVAGLFQDFYDIEGTYGRRKEGWYQDIFTAGFEGEDLPPAERWRALQWLGERTVKDPRFAVAMVEHVYYILTGRKALLPPKELDDPLYAAKQRAYREQRREVEKIAEHFAAADYNLKVAFQDWVVSDFYRADGAASAELNPERRAELDDIGLVRMLAPEQVERKIAAVFGQPWGKLNGQLAMLYGGIDSREVTERAADPSGAMGAIQRILANDIARMQVVADFKKSPDERRLFPGIEPDVLPGASPESDAAIRRAAAHLHKQLLGRDEAVDSPEIDRTSRLFAGIVEEAQHRKQAGIKEDGPRSNFSSSSDPNYTVRAWIAVVTYLLRRPEFLYE